MPAGAAAVAYRPDEFERRLRWLHGTVTRHFRAVVTRFPQASACRELRGCFRIPDVVVLTLRPGACRASDVRREANALRAAGANLAGVILTKAEQQPQAI